MFKWKEKNEEFGPTIQYGKGCTNVEANALSRLSILEEQQGIEAILLNHPQDDPHHPILNKYPLNQTLKNKQAQYQVKQQAWQCQTAVNKQINKQG